MWYSVQASSHWLNLAGLWRLVRDITGVGVVPLHTEISQEVKTFWSLAAWLEIFPLFWKFYLWITGMFQLHCSFWCDMNSVSAYAMEKIGPVIIMPCVYCWVCSTVCLYWNQRATWAQAITGQVTSGNHRADYFSNLACDWLSIVWANSEQATENRPRAPNFIDGLMQDCDVSIVNLLEIPQSCTLPTICSPCCEFECVAK